MPACCTAPVYTCDRLLDDARLAYGVVYTSAQALGLPLLPPSLSKNQSFKQGANFAVAGATALKTSLSPAFYPQAGGRGANKPPPNNISLSDELQWFDAMKPSLCGSPQGNQTVHVNFSVPTFTYCFS